MEETDLSDAKLAEEFKRECNEQFQVLVRMHLSFILDQHTQDEEESLTDRGKMKKWAALVPFSKKKKGAGTVIESNLLSQEAKGPVYQLIDFLKEEQNIKTEGIFRRTGSLARQQELRSLLGQTDSLDLNNSNYSVHDCASVLKGFLAELPEPLLTEAHYPAYCQVAELCLEDGQVKEDNGKLLAALQLLLLLLPTENKILLKRILELLHLTASLEEHNRMSASNLAKLFTPHLVSPRKLTPEQLHSDSRNMCPILSFMISNHLKLSGVPAKLVTDFRFRQQNNLRSNQGNVQTPSVLNESVDNTANTVFTFVDRARTAEENRTNTTETALAQLYAHIQSLPESSKKRKLVKQFNKENGRGTPLQALRTASSHSTGPRNKGLGDSIKKHIFQKSMARNFRKGAFAMKMSTTPTKTPSPNVGKNLFPTECSDDVSNPSSTEEDVIYQKKPKFFGVETSTPSIKLVDVKLLDEEHEQEGVHLLFTPENEVYRSKSMSPITRSTQRMSRAMQETMMTPRSRKPVLLVSGTNINSLAKTPSSGSNATLEKVTEEQPKTDNDSSLSEAFKNYLTARTLEISSASPNQDSSFSSRTDDFNSDCALMNESNSKLSESLMFCLNGGEPTEEEKEPVLKPKQFDENGQPIVFETSF